MTDEESRPFGENLVFEDRIPLAWREIERTPPAAQILRTHEANERVLRCLATLDEYHTDSAEEEYLHGHGAHDLTRVEFKLNLLLDMMARILVHHMSVPEPVPVRIGATSIQWESEQAPSLGHYVGIDVYLNQKYPSPVTLFGVVRAVQPEDGTYRVDVGYKDMSEAVQGWIEKLIFRQHRRLVAQARHGSRGHT
jgi:hypothetical protein